MKAPALFDDVVRTALIQGPWRYTLRRIWKPGEPALLWIMLNPSTADGTVDDPTIRRCMGFARAWGFGEMTVVNLFAKRATDPRELRIHPQMFDQSTHLAVVGPDNDEHIQRETDAAEMVVAAWGAHGSLHNRDEEVCELLRGEPLWTLGLTKLGQPRHPLYVPARTGPQRWMR